MSIQAEREPARAIREGVVLGLACLSCALSLFGARADAQRRPVRCGADVFITDSLPAMRGLRIGVVCNRSSILSTGEHLLDALRRRADPAVSVIFTPEHGLDAAASAGESLKDGEWNGIPVVSLYGRQRKPSPEHLRDIDALVFDLQDVGARFYTYVSTMLLCMDAASRARLPFYVLDRPNPVDGVALEGPVLDLSESSFIGMLPIPVRHGMTIGELARMAVGERWTVGGAAIDLRVVRMQRWKRRMWFSETGLPWIAPSPNIPDDTTALAYLATCYFEGTNLSEGRGTATPFRVFGAPFMQPDTLRSHHLLLALPGVRFEPVEFTPRALTGAQEPKHQGVLCKGFRLVVTDRRAFTPVRTGLVLLSVLRGMYPERLTTSAHLDKLLGRKNVVSFLRSPESADSAAASWIRETRQFGRHRKKYLLY